MGAVTTPTGRAAVGRSPLAWLAALTPTGSARVPLAWALYDFANTIFSFGVVSSAIGLWLTDDARLGEGPGQLVLGIAVFLSVGLNALVSPVLGAISDRAGRRLPYLLVFTVLCIVPTVFIALVPLFVGVALFVVANFAYQAALIYYDATLKTVGYPETRGRLSGLGVGLGYVGSIVIGLTIFLAGIPVEAVFVLVAVLYAIFAIPIFLVVREQAKTDYRFRLRDAVASWSQIATSFRHAGEVPGLRRFLLGRFFYTDAVNTVIVVMTVFAREAMGLSTNAAFGILAALTVVAVVASVGWGRLVDRIGPKRTLIIVLASWAIGLGLAGVSLSIPNPDLAFGTFLLAGAILGSGLGGVQVADRILLLRLAPPERVGELFGLYGLVGKASQLVGLLLYTWTIFLFLDALGDGAYQLGILTLFVTMLIGLWIIRPVGDRWHGSGELGPQDPEPVAPPERLAPMSQPLEPR
jgi:UMF1 family MFS transporter